ncbi:unnamed protein product [Auanema sp. JU1783]|nr:unnamed protein product [Auanema sp. JU1783]
MAVDKEDMPYFMSKDIVDQRDPNRQTPHRLINLHELAKVGVEFLERDQMELPNLAAVYSMKNRDAISISKATPGYNELIKGFFKEHLHKDAELRFIKSGSGYFDVRSADDEWIRIPVCAGDFLFLPPGIYHRFTTDHNDMVEAIRFFQCSPRWTAYLRDDDGDKQPERNEFLLKNGLIKSDRHQRIMSDIANPLVVRLNPNGTEYTCVYCNQLLD